MLRVENVSAGYGAAPIVRNVSLSATGGEVTALVGPNGCGKSTLLKAMARILTLQAGDVFLGDDRVHSLPTRKVAQRMALLPQGPIAPEGLTVRELIAQGRFPHQTLLRQWSAEDSRAVALAMQATQTEEFADRPVDSLSGGQRQRCWIAMVLAQDTPVILLDEPTTFLDLKVQVDLMRLLTRIARQENRTLVIVLHELNLAASFADQVVMMREGRIAAMGAPCDVFTPETLHSVFDLDARVIRDEATGRPFCLPDVPELAL